MKRLISTHITGKMCVGLLTAEAISLCLILFITFFITKPRLERQTLAQAAEDGERLASDLDDTLQSMCQTIEYLCLAPDFMDAVNEAEEGSPAGLTAELNGFCRFETLHIRAAAAYEESLGWYLSDGEFSESDTSALTSPSIQALSAESPGPLIANIYTGWSVNDSLSAGMALVSDSGAVWRVVFIFDSETIKDTISTALSYDYTGFEIGRVYGPGFFSGGDSGSAHEVLAENTASGNYIVEENGSFYIITQTSYNWRICGHISAAAFAEAYMPGLRRSLLLCLLMLAVSLAILLPLTRGMLRPIRSLQQSMTEAAAGDLDVRVDIPTQDEFHQLGIYFNEMLTQIKAHMDDAVKLEASEQNLRHSLLISQVNYHFIYNAMSTINSLARRQDSETIIRLNTALAEILQQDMLVQNGQMTCALGRELAVVENYWAIEQISHRGAAALHISCARELMDTVIPRSLLQPLVENSLRHGLIDEESGQLRGEVDITAEKRDDRLILRVADNGRGIEPGLLQILRDPRNEPKNGRHIGLANIRKRLAYIYGGRAGLDIQSGGGFTVITIEIPLS